MSPTLIDSIFIYLRNTRYYLILVSAANRYITIREGYLEKLLKRNNIITKMVLFYFKFVILFRYYCEIISERIQSQWLCTIFLCLSLYLSAIHLAWLGWVFMFLIWRLEFSFSIIHHFYKSRTSLIPQHFPDSQDPKRRMHKAAKIVAEAIQQNKVAVTVATGAAGFTAWKYMDYKAAVETRETVRETTKATIEAEAIQRQKDRENVSLNAQSDRNEEDRRHKENLDAADRQHKENLDAAALSAQKDREAEYVRHRETLEAEDRRALLNAEKDRENAYRMHRETLEAEDRRHRESLEIENQKNRETRLSDIAYSTESINEVVDSTQIVD